MDVLEAFDVQAILRDPYVGPDKLMVRRNAVYRLMDEGATTVLDLWGGGISADLLVQRGATVIAVESGKNLPDGLERAQVRDAVETLARYVPYDLRWSSAEAAAGLCDAAFIDLCGQWSPATRRLLERCRHMKAIAVTLMPERTPLGRLTVRDWYTALTALLVDATGMNLASARLYRRRSGLPAMVFVMTPGAQAKTYAAYANTIRRDKARDAERTAEHRAKKAEAKARRLERPDARDRDRAYRRLYQRTRSATDPEFRAKHRERSRLYAARRRAAAKAEAAA